MVVVGKVFFECDALCRLLQQLSAYFYSLIVFEAYYFRIRCYWSFLCRDSLEDFRLYRFSLVVWMHVRLLMGAMTSAAKPKTWGDMQASATWQSCGCSILNAYCAEWTIEVLRQRLLWEHISRVHGKPQCIQAERPLKISNGDVVNGLTTQAILLSISIILLPLKYFSDR